MNSLGIVYSQTSGNAQGLLEGRLVKRMQPRFRGPGRGPPPPFWPGPGLPEAVTSYRGPTVSTLSMSGANTIPTRWWKGWGIITTLLDLSLKPYPCCRMTHAAIDAALQLRDPVGESLDHVDSVDVAVSRMVVEMVGKPFVVGTDPQVDAQFSIPYTVGTALLRGDVFLEDFETDRIMEAERGRLSRRVKVVPDPHLPHKDIMRAAMAVKMKDGRVHQAEIDAPLGNPANPLSLDRCRGKFENMPLVQAA